MKTALALLVALLAACADGPWGDVPGAEVTPIGRDGWEDAVDEAVSRWNAALVARGCPAPFELGESGHPVELVADEAWAHGDGEAGMEGDGWIDVRDLEPAAPPADWAIPLLLHELGHAMGLEHRHSGITVMTPAPWSGEVHDVDAAAAAASLGC